MGESRLSGVGKTAATATRNGGRNRTRSPSARARSPPRKQRQQSQQPPHWRIPSPDKRKQEEDAGVDADREDSESYVLPRPRSALGSSAKHQQNKQQQQRKEQQQQQEKEQLEQTQEIRPSQREEDESSFLEKEDIQGLLSEIEFVRQRGKDGHMRVQAAVRRQKQNESSSNSSTMHARESSSSKAKRHSSLAKSEHVEDPHWRRIDASRPPIPLSSIGKSPLAAKSPHNRSLSRSRADYEENETGYARDMPFVVGTSTNKSHSVTANLQTVYSLLKAHNPALCSVCTKRKKNAATAADSTGSYSPSQSHRSDNESDHSHHHRKIAEASSGLAEMSKLKSVLATLQNDFNRLKLHYQSLVQYYDSVSEEMTRSSKKKNHNMKAERARLHEIGKELKEVIANMESKVSHR
ncbi:hypothetical protein BDR26DRAFT_662512 [Obelidium mucronatum]|nr:hypothetical protein BDR26DRAFT_662512 [Obelidium mucronatum]